MKIHLLTAATAIVFLFTACKNNPAPANTVQEKKAVIQEDHNEAFREAPALSFEGIAAPQFKDEALNQWVRAYIAFLEKWKAASKNGKRKDFSMPASTALQNLSSDPAESKKYTDFMDALSPKISAMMKAE